MLITILKDIVKHTSLGAFDAVKITGTGTETLVEAVNGKDQLILKAKLNQPCDDLRGEFGMNALTVLAGYLDFPSFRAEGAKVEIERRVRGGEEIPVKISFSDPNGQNFNYRLMAKNVVAVQPEIPDVTWNVEFVPQKPKIEEFRKLASILSGVHKEFLPRTLDGNLRFYIGGENTATHDGFMVFEHGITGKLTGGTAWPIPTFLNVLRLADQTDVTVRMSEDSGLLAASVNSGVAEYTFIIGGRDASAS